MDTALAQCPREALLNRCVLSQFHLIQGLDMTKPKLSNTAGLFTMFDHELLEQAKFDHQHTVLNHGETRELSSII